MSFNKKSKNVRIIFLCIIYILTICFGNFSFATVSDDYDNVYSAEYTSNGKQVDNAASMAARACNDVNVLNYENFY